MLVVLLFTVSLGLVGFALDAAFHKSSEAGLQARMESMVYLVLAATEVNDDGSLGIDDDLAEANNNVVISTATTITPANAGRVCGCLLCQLKRLDCKTKPIYTGTYD